MENTLDKNNSYVSNLEEVKAAKRICAMLELTKDVPKETLRGRNYKHALVVAAIGKLDDRAAELLESVRSGEISKEKYKEELDKIAELEDMGAKMVFENPFRKGGKWVDIK